jgi:hypothetical protein
MQSKPFLSGVLPAAIFVTIALCLVMSACSANNDRFEATINAQRAKIAELSGSTPDGPTAAPIAIPTLAAPSLVAKNAGTASQIAPVEVPTLPPLDKTDIYSSMEWVTYLVKYKDTSLVDRHQPE